ncbi:AraC family transcriptional regulator [Paraburkholderia phytofirmans OLGA172]|uniref:AraC family transcriptional regulator n=1 Tax=Paraburkholderia phytofirmans OLGA172 TaxID=1417228 RepID=A0A160FIL2_9BURK|nr:helix-turn-helix domain-containing protein [Paraburkholderia phytofirmans]ANB72100.1 AraC family transcriptional regulator [Paraburkholderia phytofirmans OLGA172]
MRPKPTMEWSTLGVAPADKTDAWESVLSNSYRDWHVPCRLPATFYANVKRHDFGGAELVETVCDPCSGQRLRAQMRRDDELFVGIQLTTEGRERFKIGDTGAEAVSGDLLVWRTDLAVQFEVLERLHKMTLMVPWSLLRERMPERKSPPVGGKIESRTGVGCLLAVHLLALSNQITTLDSRLKGSVSRSTLEFIGIALSDLQPSASFDASASMLSRVHDYVLDHLQDEDLTPARIAEANRISLRYLHMLFHHSGATVSGWIQDKRLSKCRDALTDSAYSRQRIADIAYRWGFSSTSHFSRAFKEKFGMSPGDVRKMAGIVKHSD